MSPADERRLALLQWLRERPTHRGLTASEIVSVIGHPYDRVTGAYDKCFADLKALEKRGLLTRGAISERPARWWPT